jgi:hypothetical protein
MNWCANCGVAIDERNSEDGVVCNTCLDECSYCNECGCLLNTDEEYWYEDDVFCTNCYSDIYFYCESCDNDALREEGTHVHNDDGSVTLICEYCVDNKTIRCESGGHNVWETFDYIDENGRSNSVCSTCLEDIDLTVCYICGNDFSYQLEEMHGNPICITCKSDIENRIEQDKIDNQPEGDQDDTGSN